MTPTNNSVYAAFTDQEVVDATVKANHDRDFLAHLRKVGKVWRRDGAFEAWHPELAKPFVRDIEQRAKPDINLAIKRKDKKRKKR